MLNLLFCHIEIHDNIYEIYLNTSIQIRENG